jgi:hypothetical protein
VNTSTTQTNAAPATSGALTAETYNRARAICSCRHHAFPCEKCEMLKDTENASQHTPEPLTLHRFAREILTQCDGDLDSAQLRAYVRFRAEKVLSGKGGK